MYKGDAIMQVDQYELFTGDSSNIFKENSLPENLYAVSICLSGKLDMEINGHQATIKPNYLLYLTSNHEISTVEASPEYKAIKLVFEKNFLQESDIHQEDLESLLYISPNCPPVFNLVDGNFGQLKEILTRINKEKDTSKKFHKQIIRHQIIELLFRINRNDKSCLVRESIQDSRTKLLLQEFRELINENYKTKKKVKDYAELLYVSPKYLSEVAKKETGRPALQLIHGKLLSEAKKRLKGSNKSVKEIAYMLGFSNPSYFSRFFKRETNQSPGEYRKSRKIEY